MNTPLFNPADARAARRMAEMIALGIELRETPTTARDIRQFADSLTGLTAADVLAPTRTRPEARGLRATDGEALGRIDPDDAGTFALWLTEAGYAFDFLTVNPDGRVTLRSGGVDDVEALELGMVIADFLHHRTGAVDAGRVEVERTGEFFKPLVVLADGSRIHTHTVCVTLADAQGEGEKLLRQQRPTVARTVEGVKAA